MLSRAHVSFFFFFLFLNECFSYLVNQVALPWQVNVAAIKAPHLLDFLLTVVHETVIPVVIKAIRCLFDRDQYVNKARSVESGQDAILCHREVLG